MATDKQTDTTSLLKAPSPQRGRGLLSLQLAPLRHGASPRQVILSGEDTYRLLPATRPIDTYHVHSELTASTYCTR